MVSGFKSRREVKERADGREDEKTEGTARGGAGVIIRLFYFLESVGTRAAVRLSRVKGFQAVGNYSLCLRCTQRRL